MKKVIVLKVLVGLLFLFAFIQGIHHFVYELDDNKCEMTYMFEYPQYIKIKLPENSSSVFPYYNLYVYGEGKQAERYHKGKFSGIPVLYIPGNAGVYKQVRSLASLAYRQSLDSRKNFHFDFFAIDFNEELSALYGGVLDHQTVFASDCIQKILSIYNSTEHQHKSLLIIGHSMGGIVAKAVSSKNKDPFLVNTIITLATPHRSPVIALDEDLANFYHRINQFWLESANVTENVALASIGGADRDIQVRSGLTASNPPAVNALTTEIPTVWLAVDHQCIVWCKQVVKTVVRTLFDMIDPSTQSWIQNIELRKRILSYHLVKRGLGKHFENLQGAREVDFDPDGRWREVIASRFTADAEMEDRSNSYFMVPLIDNAYRDRLEAVASGLPIKYWVFGCAALAWKNSVRFCERGIDLSHRSSLLPNTGDNIKRKLIYLDLVELREKGFTHVIFNIPKRHQKGSVEFHVHRSSDRKLEIHFPFKSYIPFVSIGHVVIPNNAMSYNISLPNLSKSWQSISLKTRQNSCPTQHNALIRKIVPWSHENQYYLSNQSFSVHLHVPKSPADSEYDSAYLQFINPHPQCGYEIEISTDWIGMWSQLVRFYSPFLISLIFAIFLHCLSTQLREKQFKNSVPSTLSCLIEMPVIKMAVIPEALSILFGLIESLHLRVWPSFLTPDEVILQDDGLGFPLMYLLLGGVAWVFAIILTIVIWLGISAGGHILHTFIIRHLRGSFGFPLIVAELVAMGISRIPLMISVVLIAIASSTCGSLGLCLGLGVFIWKLFSYYEDELESMLSEEESKEVDDDFRINLTIAILWFCTALLSLPTLIVWIKSPNLILPSDHVLFPSFAWSVFGMMALQNPESNINNRLHNHVANVVSALSVLLLLFGLVSIYRIKYFVIAAIMTYVVSKYFV